MSDSTVQGSAACRDRLFDVLALAFYSLGIAAVLVVAIATAVRGG